MARLNKTELLMQQGANKEDPFLEKVFQDFLDFYVALKMLSNEDHCDVIEYLYCTNHKKETFRCIAYKLCLSLSNLEEKRRNYKKIFNFYYNRRKNPGFVIA